MADPGMMQGAATAMQMIGGIMEAGDNAGALRRSADVDRENARRTELQGEFQVLQSIRDERAVSGEAIAAMAGSGFALGTGSAADLIRQNAIEREMEIGNIRYQASGEAANLRQSADDKRRAAKSVMIGGVMTAIGAGVTGTTKRAAEGVLDYQRAKERDVMLTQRTGIVAGDGIVPKMDAGLATLAKMGPFGTTRYGRRRGGEY